MTFWPFDDPAECHSVFQQEYGRPPPWYELADVRVLEELAWRLSFRLRMEPRSICIDVVTQFVYQSVLKRAKDSHAYRGGTEPLRLAMTRLSIPTGGAVWLWRELCTRDLLELETVLWRDDSWVIDEDACWILAGLHDCQCERIDLRRRAE
jgi:hypothetical protein